MSVLKYFMQNKRFSNEWNISRLIHHTTGVGESVSEGTKHLTAPSKKSKFILNFFL